MSSTNKTANLELSQFLGTDKPAWLTDYNADMSKIDTGVHNAQSTATGADGKADTNATAIGTLANLTTEAKTNLVAAINEVDSHADTAQGTANDAVAAAASNTTKITALDAYLNLNNFDTPVITVSGGTLYSGSSVSSAANASGSLGKVYGWIRVTATSSTINISFPTLLRPSSQITVNGIVISQVDNGSSWAITQRPLVIDTDGTAHIQITDTASSVVWRLNLAACVIFAKSFGDVPIPE